MNENLKKAIEEWQIYLNDNCILLNADNISKYQYSTLGSHYTTKCVLTPTSSEELSLCLKISNKYNIKVFPISRGQNHGYNSAVPLSNNTVVIDLRNMDSIIEYNQEFGYVVIEPGVTFIELYKFLADKGCNHLISGFTGSPHASIMGNALDRGIGRGQYGNRQLSCEVKEIALANGTLVDLRDRYNFNDTTINLQHSVMGIDLGPLFYQSNLCVVTKVIIHLEPIPEYLLIISIEIDSDEKMLQAISKFKNLNNMRVIEPVYAIYNDIKLLVSSGIYKKSDMNLKHPLPSELGLSKWNSSFAIHCSCEEELHFKRRLITEQLNDLSTDLSFKHIDKLSAIKLIQASLKIGFEPNKSEIKYLFNLGFTNDSDQKTLYWDSKTLFSQRTDPVDDNCGLIFFAPKIPFNPSHIKQALYLLNKTAEMHGMETPITIQFKSKQIVCLILPIIFNLAEENSKIKAHNYYNELFDLFSKNGYIPSRVNSISMPVIFNTHNSFNDLYKKIKFAFDENEIISPNRYSR